MARRLLTSLCFYIVLVTPAPAAEKEGTIHGRVLLLPLWEAASGAEVSLYSVASPWDSPVSEVRHVAKARTDSSGAYRFTDLAFGMFHVKAELAGWHSRTARYVYVWSGGKPVVDIHLQIAGFGPVSTGELAGEVHLEDGKPVQDATVTILRFDAEGTPPQQRTDDRGRFRFEALQTGTYAVQVAKPCYEPSYSLVEVKGTVSRKFVLKTVRRP
jgi:hypothetical protein